MPAHDVEMSIPTTKVVLHADVVFEIRSDDEKLGELPREQGLDRLVRIERQDPGEAHLGAVRPSHARPAQLEGQSVPRAPDWSASGRDDELTIMRAALDAARSGRPSVVLVMGDLAFRRWKPFPP